MGLIGIAMIAGRTPQDGKKNGDNADYHPVKDIFHAHPSHYPEHN
jgi:hypothetical protein